MPPCCPCCAGMAFGGFTGGRRRARSRSAQRAATAWRSALRSVRGGVPSMAPSTLAHPPVRSAVLPPPPPPPLALCPRRQRVPGHLPLPGPQGRGAVPRGARPGQRRPHLPRQSRRKPRLLLAAACCWLLDCLTAAAGAGAAADRCRCCFCLSPAVLTTAVPLPLLFPPALPQVIRYNATDRPPKQAAFPQCVKHAVGGGRGGEWEKGEKGAQPTLPHAPLVARCSISVSNPLNITSIPPNHPSHCRYEYPRGKERYAELADMLGLGGPGMRPREKVRGRRHRHSPGLSGGVRVVCSAPGCLLRLELCLWKALLARFTRCCSTPSRACRSIP